jgi:hypothetical protein
MIALKVPSTPYFLSCSFNNSKMADFQISEVDVLHHSALFNSGWVTMSKHSCCNHGNEGIWFTVEKGGHNHIADLKYKGSMKDK